MVARNTRLQPAETPGILALRRELKAAANPEQAATLAWFFKTAKGEYGEGDRFLGIKVPVLRKLARKYKSVPLKQVETLLSSPIHECRFVALAILVDRYKKGSAKTREEIFRLYLSRTKWINNWDLVDVSAPYIVGEHLTQGSQEQLMLLARSGNVWERRIAIVATFAFIRRGQIDFTLRIALELLGDKHDLIHKATGWALREAGKVSAESLREFLREHYPKMPRTALRYAIERFPAAERARMLSGSFDGGGRQAG